MKRVLRKYLSAILLLCLLIQLAPLSLLHSHEDHLTEIGHNINSIHDHDAHHGNSVIDNTHNESSEEECNVCKIQQSLNNQAYSLGKQVHVFNFKTQSVVFLELGTSIDDHLIKSTSGRAPPLV